MSLEHLTKHERAALMSTLLNLVTAVAMQSGAAPTTVWREIANLAKGMAK